jgi:hypothetical protein
MRSYVVFARMEGNQTSNNENHLGMNESINLEIQIPKKSRCTVGLESTYSPSSSITWFVVISLIDEEGEERGVSQCNTG